MNRENISDVLYSKIQIVKPYPNSVDPVGSMINATAFFPGGRGLWMEKQSSTFPSILVLGQDFSTQAEYLKMINGKTNDLNCPTWRNIIKLFKEAEINLEECFFSNVFMGFRNTDSMIGKFPGFKDKGFTKRNIDFLAYQIEILKPKIIITLGIYAARMLADLSVTDLVDWKSAKTFNQIADGIKLNVSFNKHRCICVALVHPSLRSINVKKRYYNGCFGNDAELSMLREALKEGC